MASNIPLGTFLEDGVRTGPLYSGQVPASLLPFNPTLDLSYSSYSSYGPAVLLSTQNTWNITPQPTGVANVVARTNALADITHMVLTGDNSATKLISQSNSPTLTQFDWPRVPTVTISTANLNAPLRVTIFGFDWYGNPMQHTYVVQNIGTYPSGTTAAKAFYSVSQVSISGQLTNGAFISVGASDVFGLPYQVNNAGDITSIGWGKSSDLQDNAGLLASPVTGTATLVGGTVTVPVNAVTTSSKILISRNTPGGTVGNLSVPDASVTANTSFVINSDSNIETSTVNWEVVNPLSQYSASGGSSAAPSAAMAAGVVTIFTSQVQANSNIQLTMGTFGTAHGQWYVSAIVPGVSFTVTSTANNETSTLSWTIMPSNWQSGTSNALGSGVNPVAGQIFVPAPSVVANSNILLTYATTPGVNGGVLSAPVASILPGVGFTIVSSNNADTATVNWAITNLVAGSTSGTSTLVAGTVVVTTAAVATNSVILLTDNTLGTPTPYVRVSARTAGTSFTILAQANTDTSTINWAIFPANFILPNTVSPLGTFTPADQTFPVTSTTGDVRGLYAPSTPSNGVRSLRFTAYIKGADQWINQTANDQLVDSSQGQPIVGTAINPLNPQNLYGNPQFYTGSNS